MAVTSRSLNASGVETRHTRKLTFIERLTPRWGRQAAWWIEEEAADSAPWFVVSGVMTVVVIGIGFLMLFGDGYATIQGIRYFLRALGVPHISVEGMPAIQWWSIQVVLVFIQVFGKVINGMRPLWTPSYIFNVLTTAAFIGIGTSSLLGLPIGLVSAFHPTESTIMCGVIGTILGHFLALGAEQVTITGFCMLGALFTALKR